MKDRIQKVERAYFEGKPYGVATKEFFVTDPFLDELGLHQVNPETYYGLTKEEVARLVELNKLQKPQLMEC